MVWPSDDHIFISVLKERIVTSNRCGVNNGGRSLMKTYILLSNILYAYKTWKEVLFVLNNISWVCYELWIFAVMLVIWLLNSVLIVRCTCVFSLECYPLWLFIFDLSLKRRCKQCTTPHIHQFHFRFNFQTLLWQFSECPGPQAASWPPSSPRSKRRRTSWRSMRGCARRAGDSNKNALHISPHICNLQSALQRGAEGCGGDWHRGAQPQQEDKAPRGQYQEERGQVEAEETRENIAGNS